MGPHDLIRSEPARGRRRGPAGTAEGIATTLESIPVDGGRELEDLTTGELARVMVKIQRLRRAKIRDLENLTVELARARQDATTDHARAFLAHEGPQEERTQTAKLAAAGAVLKADVARGSSTPSRRPWRASRTTDPWASEGPGGYSDEAPF